MVTAVSRAIVFGVQRIGRYEVLNHLASGGMGQVYLARATGLGGFERQVVVKTLDPSITDDDESFVTMFLDEARLVGALHHQYIAPVYEVGCDDEGRYYLVMDYVQGETAEAVFRASNERGITLPLGFSLTVASCVASALDYAHSLCAADGTPLDIVHRDVSLSNVMCGHDGAVKLIDFGIAKAANRATRTQVGTLKGKIGYLAPEQILRQPVDHRADIFALGIVLYELTTGERAFHDGSDLLTLERITKGELKRPSEVKPGYPAELERIVMKALRVEPARRYQDAGALARDLEAYAAALGIPLGHAPVADMMGTLFSERRGRRRMARGSNEAKTDPTLSIGDELTGTQTIASPGFAGARSTPEGSAESIDNETLTRAVAVDGGRSARAQRPTTPLVDRTRPPRPTDDIDPPTQRRPRSSGPMPAVRATGPVPVLARPTSSPAIPVPLECRPTSIASLPLPPPERPTPPERPRIITGPPLPTVYPLEDAPTELNAPTVDPPEPPRVTFRPRTITAHVVRPAPRFDPQTRTWLILCALFALSVLIAIVVAIT